MLTTKLATKGKTDSQVQMDVLEELKWDTRVSATDVGVEVDNGIVTLTGTVDSWAKRSAAAEAAHRVVGVLDVANDIAVKTQGGLTDRTDTDIAQAVRNALEWDILVPEKQIQTTVSQGFVTLKGKVEYWSQREDAERAIRNLLGVRGVTNLIEVWPENRVTSVEVRRSIEDALERRALRESSKLDIKVDDGKVCIAGPVSTYKERAAIIGAAKATYGVRSVDDKLRINWQEGRLA
jgi:osmotically-inducible protein OsmY